MPAKREIEIKLPLQNAVAGRRELLRAGFQRKTNRVREFNIVFDFADGRLRRAGALLRLRKASHTAVLTYKGPAESARHKIREELEVEVSEFDTAQQILSLLRLEPVFRYEKFRTEFASPRQAGVATLDETPIGVFCELEGHPSWIDRTARRLGFDESDYITSSYATLYLNFCKRQGLPPEDMVFSSG